jgi:non-homologous end joining protein Ku
VDGQETVAVETAEPSSNLIDLMAALEASVNAAKAARDVNPAKPVSVADAQAAKASEDQAARPARRRKSA